MGTSFEIRGVDSLMRKLQKMQKMDSARQVVKSRTSDLNRAMVRHAVFTKGYTTGQTRRSIVSNIRDGGLTGAVKPTTHYSVYLEYGTRYMSAQPFVGPAFHQVRPQFISDLQRLVR